MNSTEMAKTIIDIARTRGINAKMAKLSQYNDLYNICRTTYSPYIHFGIKAVTPRASGTCDFEEANVGALLQRLRVGKLTGHAAKLTTTAVLESLEPYSQDLLIKILNKDLRFGMQATSINKVFPECVPVFPVQLAKAYEAGRVQFPCLASPKLDGLRCVYDNGVLRSRYGNALVGLDHIAKFIKQHWPKIVRLDGELMVPGMSFNALSGNIRSFTKSSGAVYHVFDMFGADTTVPFHTRYASYMVALASRPVGFLNPVQHDTVTNETQVQSYYQKCRDHGFEGIVLKNEYAGEVIGRTWDWCKLKPKDTADCMVTGVEYGSGKYARAVGALVVDFNGRECRVGGGLSDAQRFAWYEDQNIIVGKTVEVDYMEVTEFGAMRHPRLKVVRGDK